MTAPNTPPYKPRVTPWWTMAGAVALIALAVVLLLAPIKDTGHVDAILSIIIAAVPGLIAASFAERASKDIRNGVVVDKARIGANAALAESGVTDVVDMTQRGKTSLVAIEALLALLNDREKAQQVKEAAANLADTIPPTETPPSRSDGN